MDNAPNSQFFYVSDIFFIIELMDGMRDPIWAT